MNFIICTPSPVFYKSVATAEEKHTGDYISLQIESVMAEIGIQKFVSVVTDNASAMLKAAKILTTKYPHITSYGCAAYVLHLLIGDILKVHSILLVKTEANDIVKQIIRSHCVQAKFTKLQKQKNVTNISLKLPGKTRWGSILYCFRRLLANKFTLKALAVSEGIENYLTPSVLESILNEETFWSKICLLISIFEVIVKWITLLEGDEPKISLVVEAFHEIELIWQKFLNSDIITIEEKHQLNECLKKRKQYVLKPIHFAANILDPAFNGVHLSNNEQVLGTEYIDQKSIDMCPNHSIDIMTQLTEYRCKEGFFSNSYVFKSVDKLSPTVWWKGTCFCLKLSVIALAILEMPPTTAATERTFSTQGFIHSPRRNRLTTDRAAKLTFISHNLKMMNRKGYNKCSSHINNDNSPDHENTLNNENQSNLTLESHLSTNSLDLDNSSNIVYGHNKILSM